MKYFILALLLTSMVSALDVNKILNDGKKMLIKRGTIFATCAAKEMKDIAKEELGGLLKHFIGGRRRLGNWLKKMANKAKKAGCSALAKTAEGKCVSLLMAALGKAKEQAKKIPKIGDKVYKHWPSVEKCTKPQVEWVCHEIKKKFCGRRRTRRRLLPEQLKNVLNVLKKRAKNVFKCVKTKAVGAAKKMLFQGAKGIMAKLSLGRRLNLIGNAFNAVKHAAAGMAKGPLTAACKTALHAAISHGKDLIGHLPEQVRSAVTKGWDTIKGCFDAEVDGTCEEAVKAALGGGRRF